MTTLISVCIPHIVPWKVKSPICYSNEWQIGPFSSEGTIKRPWRLCIAPLPSPAQRQAGRYFKDSTQTRPPLQQGHLYTRPKYSALQSLYPGWCLVSSNKTSSENKNLNYRKYYVTMSILPTRINYSVRQTATSNTNVDTDVSHSEPN